MGNKIIVVDDSPETIYTIKEGMNELNADYEILSAENGEIFFKIMKKETPDLILLDIMMPGMNGWKIFKKIRENSDWSKIPIVFLTAKSDNCSKAFGKILAQEYVEKPFELEELRQVIDYQLSHPFVLSETKEHIIEDMLKKAIKYEND